MSTHPISSTEYPIRTSARKVMRNCAELEARIAAVGGAVAVSVTAGRARESTSWWASALEMLDRSWHAATTVIMLQTRHGTPGTHCRLKTARLSRREWELRSRRLAGVEWTRHARR